MDLNREKQLPDVGKSVTYKGNKHYIAYKSPKGDFVLISKSKNLIKKFSVKTNQITYEQR